MGSCGELFLKAASSTFTGYFFIISLAFMIYGLISTYVLLIINDVQTLEEEYVALPSLCLVIIGIFLLVFIILGCCSICREIPGCLEAYSTFLFLLSVLQVALGAFCLMQFNQNNTKLANSIFSDVNKMYMDYNYKPLPLDQTQQWLKCCGVRGPFDWHRDNRSIPQSCCDNDKTTCSMFSKDRYNDGCANVVLTFVGNTNFIIGWSSIIVAITEIIAGILGIGLSCIFWRDPTTIWV